MFGKGLMVAPVTQPSADVRTVYLPGKQPWYDFWSGKRFEGGRVIAAKADINTIPVFMRSGSILPLGPVKQYADQPSTEAMELRVYPGRDGSFLLYDDEGDGYGYEQGRFATVMLTWNEAQRRFTFGKRSGKYPGMSPKQTFRVVCGTAPAGSEMHEVTYTGAGLSIELPECAGAM
jgi:alpha-D-xyloside xylohydrolase